MIAIYKKELHSYLTNISGWLFLSFLLLVVGLYHWVTNLYSGYSQFGYTISSITVIFVLIVPIFTMRIMAEENHQKTDQLLLTAPVSITGIVLGKFLAMVTIFAAGMLVVSTYPLTTMKYSTLVNLKEDYIAILMFFFMGAAYMALGMFISAMVESQILAAVLTFAAFIFTLFADSLASLLPTDNASALIVLSMILIITAIVIYLLTKNVWMCLAIPGAIEIVLVVIYLVKASLFDGILYKLFNCTAIYAHISNAVNGIFSLADLVYFFSVIFMFLFFTVQAINKKRYA